MAFGEPAPVARILAVDHDEIEPVVLDELWQPLAHRVAPRPADDIAQEQQPHQLSPPKLR
jgi:hypothetical protein